MLCLYLDWSFWNCGNYAQKFMYIWVCITRICWGTPLMWTGWQKQGWIFLDVGSWLFQYKPREACTSRPALISAVNWSSLPCVGRHLLSEGPPSSIIWYQIQLGVAQTGTLGFEETGSGVMLEEEGWFGEESLRASCRASPAPSVSS